MDENRRCIYCHLEVLDTQPHSIRKMNGKKHYWHYKCYSSHARSMYELTEEERKYLVSLVLKESNGMPDDIALLALRAIGYGK